MQNVDWKVEKGKLTITVDVSDKALSSAVVSKTGKSKIVAGTGGFVKINDSVSMSLNVITK